MELSEYFAKNRYKPKYFLGDRVFGKWNKIPFAGTVANDSLVTESDGPVVSVFVDLPIKFKSKWYTIIHVKHKDIKPLKELTDGSSSKKRVAPSRKKVRA